MSRLTRKYIRALIYEELSRGRSLLTEEEEDEGTDIFGGGDEEEGGDEEAAEGEDEGGEAEGGDESAEEGSDEGEEGAEEAGEEAEDSEDASEATGPSDSGVDVEINAVMAEFEQEALDAAAAQNESKNLSLKILLEEEGAEEIPIDMDNFAGNVARLISNYHNLIDMEMVIFNKAKSFLEDKYGKETVDELETILSSRYDIEIESTYDPEKEETPEYATGAMNAQA